MNALAHPSIFRTRQERRSEIDLIAKLASILYVCHLEK